MTTNQIAYWNLQELKRANRTKEFQTQQKNTYDVSLKAQELEDKRNFKLLDNNNAALDRASRELIAQRANAQQNVNNITGLGQSIIGGLLGMITKGMTSTPRLTP